MKKTTQIGLLLCLLPFFSVAQQPINKESRFSVNFQTGLVTTYMNLDKHYNWYHEICCFGYTDDDPDSELTFANHTNISLNYRIKRRHQIGLGLELSQMGENHQAGERKRDVLTYVGAIGSYEITLLHTPKASIGLYNAVMVEMPMYNDYGKHFLKGISHIGGLVWRFEVNDKWEFSVNGVLKSALTEYNPISWYYDNHRLGYGILLGLNYKI